VRTNAAESKIDRIMAVLPERRNEINGFSQ
jgi:hypothetical protein